MPRTAGRRRRSRSAMRLVLRADLTAIRATLQDALAAGCDDLMSCAASDCCPPPFIELATIVSDAG
jgi:MerR family mercuric resistance operon transcriptional regulator